MAAAKDTKRKTMSLSYSSISTYRNCPLQYKLRYIDRLPIKRKPALSFGSSVHKAVRYFYDVDLPTPPPLDDVIGFLERNWEREGYADESENSAYLDQARKVMADFYQANTADFRLPVALEHRFRVPVNGLSLSGIIDKVDRLESGGYEIIDFKTNRRLPPRYAIKDDLQLSIYHLAAEAVWGVAPEKLSLYFLLPKEKVTTQRTPEQLDTTRSIIKEVAIAIAAKDFEPKQNPLCPWCDYHAHCPFQESETVEERPNGRGDPQQLRIEDVVDEYIELKETQKRISLRLDTLQPLLLKHCEEGNISRVHGKNGIVERTAALAESYDEERLKQSLRPFKLWEEISTLDPNRLKTVLEKRDIPEGIRNLVYSAKAENEPGYALNIKVEREPGRAVLETPSLF